ncbi:putative methyltransferase [Aggregatibacter actinomycetemcomitans serotype e str. SC1083]|uniref:Ribosomal RNA small subunit methyltransferase D n=1 Tax=Aggregatibacter actinomycetemcomitans serotype e str. SC1083 TaxID=907488 RepID=G4AAW9_AGGAC|nr:16S rRNA (guanine(966)-N(2))-methyltransferase RsmD [Aggregatibacter actinomycetemcomitans]EGY32620.1 putative methyltransferase [Aggregatibacter actinomycetemcomitans serotype e str. SC1083]KYK76287.1 16S rRNA methyltransferase [Aggregatibacter actinomycetemcomitans serotype e str. SA3096]KYK77568.1 16S rRNA methyltransferase [Aggregatibacter actinomycetemcomitans serotype e str. SC936]KYK94672.1 16S rRNA methyltransferase [Aggregatibacter actinomycetemcomitans serotype e str. ANH9776]TYB2
MKKPTIPQSTKGEVRIIAGLWRGRKLPVLSSQGLRPTGDRVKETLFNWLMPYIAGSECLDCFAGSGALGFEALSRQAAKVTFLELEKAVAQQLSKNIQTLKCADRAQVVNQNSVQFLNHPQNQPHFDVVFLDPPFHFDLAEQAITLLAQHHWLRPQALVYVETEKGKDPHVPATWALLKEKDSGQVSYRLYQTE